MKTPATQLNNFIEKMAVWLKNNHPPFMTNYGVAVTNIPKSEDSSTIRFTATFEISNSEMRKLEMAGSVAEVLD